MPYLSICIAASQPNTLISFLSFADTLPVYLNKTSLEEAVYKANIWEEILFVERVWEGKENVDLDKAFSVIDILLEKENNLNDDFHFTRIALGTFRFPLTFSYLIKKGFDVNKPLNIHGDKNLLESYLLSMSKINSFNLMGNKVNITNYEKLQLKLDVLDLLIEHGAKLPYDKISPHQQLFNYSVTNNNVELITILLESGLNINVNFMLLENENLLDVAMNHNYDELVELLIQYGAKFSD